MAASANVGVVVSFLSSVQQKSRACHAPVAALKFVSGLLGWDYMLSCLSSPVVSAWFAIAASGKRARRRSRYLC